MERVGLDVAWGDYAEGRWQHRVVREEEDVNDLLASDWHIFCALTDDSVLVLDK